MNGRPKAVHEDTLSELKEIDQSERRHLRRTVWRTVKAGLGWVSVVGVIGLAWHEIIGGGGDPPG